MSRKTSLGKLISAKRKNLRLTQAELGEKIGVSKSAVAKWETDGGIPCMDNVGRISNFLGIPVADLHSIARGQEPADVGWCPNITADVIAVLESCGYKVLPPIRTDEGRKNVKQQGGYFDIQEAAHEKPVMQIDDTKKIDSGKRRGAPRKGSDSSGRS